MYEGGRIVYLDPFISSWSCENVKGGVVSFVLLSMLLLSGKQCTCLCLWLSVFQLQAFQLYSFTVAANFTV